MDLKYVGRTWMHHLAQGSRDALGCRQCPGTRNASAQQKGMQLGGGFEDETVTDYLDSYVGLAMPGRVASMLEEP